MNPILETIHNLHSTHGNFQDRPLPKEHLEAILAASVRAANASNAQNYAIIVVEDRAVMQEVCGYQASTVLVFCVDTQRNKDLAGRLGCQYHCDPAWAITSGTVGAALAAQTAALAAASLGLDTLFTNGLHRGDPRRVWKLLHLPPQNCYPVVALCLGYANAQAGPRRGRLTEPGVIHRGVYQPRDAAACDAIIACYDDPERQFDSLQQWRKNGHSHFLEGFFKGRGQWAVTDYKELAPALAAAGIEIRAASACTGKVMEESGTMGA